MITWKDTINIIKAMFEVKDKDIAEHLKVSPSTLSHVKNGDRRPTDEFNSAKVYRKIFNPTEKGSIAYDESKIKSLHTTKPEDIEKEFLSNLKIVIERGFPKVKSDMCDCWNEEDYRTFVFKLLKLTGLGANLKGTSNREDRSAPVTDVPPDNVAASVDTDYNVDLYIEDKYKCCRSCTKWQGVMGDELSICRVFKEQRDAASGKDCKYYNPNWGQMTIETLWES